MDFDPNNRGNWDINFAVSLTWVWLCRVVVGLSAVLRGPNWRHRATLEYLRPAATIGG